MFKNFAKIFYFEKSDKTAIRRYILYRLLYLKFQFEFSRLILRFLGIKILDVHFSFGYMVGKLFGFIPVKTKIFTKKLFSNFLVSYMKIKYNIENADLITFFFRSGETFLLCRYLKEFVNNNNLKNLIVISPYEHYKDIFKMYYPDINFKTIPLCFVELHFLNIKQLKLNDSFNYLNVLPHNHFVKLEKSLQNGEKKYFINEFKKTMNVKGEDEVEPQISQNSIQSAKIKLEKLNLGSKFVYMSPDAQSNSSLLREFWDKLAMMLYSKGYDILYNVEPMEYYNSYNKHCFFTLEEARYVATKAQVVIGIRSGLFDIIIQKGVKVHCIYLPFSDRGKDFPELSADKVMNTFSLKKLPNVNADDINEYNVKKYDDKDEIIDEILSKLE